MSHQRIFDFCRVYIFAARHDHVFDSVENIDIAVFVEVARVARLKPATFDDRLGSFFGHVPIALHNLTRANPNFTNFTIRHIFACVRVDDSQLNARKRFAARTQATFVC